MAQYKIKLPKGSVVTTEVDPEDTFTDLEARVSEKHDLQGKFTWHSLGEVRDMRKYQGSQRVRTVCPNPTLFHIGVIPDKKPVEAEAPAGTERHNLSIHNNIVEDEADQDNVISYPESPVGRAVASYNASIHENKASGKGKQTNHIGGPIRGVRNAVQRQ